MPGGEGGALGPSTHYRSGSITRVGDERAVEDLRLRYEGGDRSSEVLYRLAASLLASDRLDLARDYIVEGRRRFPSDHRILVLAGILAHRSGSLAEAERTFEQARLSAPRDPVVILDLGLVALESGAVNRAEPMLRSVMEQHPTSPLAQRAERALKQSRLAHPRSP